MNRKSLYIAAAVLLLGAGIYLLGSHKTTMKVIPVTQVTSSPTSAPSIAVKEQNMVTLTQNGFSPQTLTIKSGQTVVWVNNSGQDATVNSDPHPTHTNYSPLNLGGFSNGEKLSLLLPKSGTYGYHNHLNPQQTGTIIVQ